MLPVDLVVNSYERTYREVLALGFFPRIEQQNRVQFAGRFAVINNVDDRADAEQRARALVEAGEIDGFVFVEDALDEALRTTGMTRRRLGPRPYFTDYALVMTTIGTSPYLIGWDAEVALEEPADWLTASVDLLDEAPAVFSVAPRWPARTHDTLDAETITRLGPWRLTWGFSDQVWLVRRAEMQQPIYRRFAPASFARNTWHPGSFEARVESYQRSSARFRAVHESVRYVHNDLSGVVGRLGGPSFKEKVIARGARYTHGLLTRLGSQRPMLRLP